MFTYACTNCAAQFTRKNRADGLPHCSHACYVARKQAHDSLAARFWSKVTKTDDCWIWTGHRGAPGYGMILRGVASGDRDVVVYAHRVSFEIHHGPIPEGLVVRHSCDVRLCVRPDHLSLGTQADNMRDMVERGRSAKGYRHSQAKLADADVAAIRARLAAGDTQSSIAIDYGVTQSAISGIKTGKRWRFDHG